jgi:hypothetical protein
MTASSENRPGLMRCGRAAWNETQDYGRFIAIWLSILDRNLGRYTESSAGQGGPSRTTSRNAIPDSLPGL